MPGNRLGGLKTAAKLKQLYGNDVYQNIGRMGGKASKGGGFANMDREKLLAVSRLGGSRGRRGPVSTPTHSVPPADNEKRHRVKKNGRSRAATLRTRDSNGRWIGKNQPLVAPKPQRDESGRFAKVSRIAPAFEVNIQQLEQALSLCSGDHRRMIEKHYNRGRDIATKHLYILWGAAAFSTFFAFWIGTTL